MCLYRGITCLLCILGTARVCVDDLIGHHKLTTGNWA